MQQSVYFNFNAFGWCSSKFISYLQHTPCRTASLCNVVSLCESGKSNPFGQLQSQCLLDKPKCLVLKEKFLPAGRPSPEPQGRVSEHRAGWISPHPQPLIWHLCMVPKLHSHMQLPCPNTPSLLAVNCVPDQAYECTLKGTEFEFF